MSSHIKTSNYHITSDPGFQNEKFGLTQDLIDQFEGLHRAALNPKDKKIIEKLTDLILKHPKSPQLKNFLSVAYHVRGNQAKAEEANKWILSEHPDYLFAKLNLANEYMNAGEPERVPEVLGEEMEIKALYPERDIFHLSEVTAYYRAAIRYFAAIGRLDLAENRLMVLQDLAPDHPDTNAAEMTIIASKMEEDEDDSNDEWGGGIGIKNAKPYPDWTQKTPPEFTHPEIDNLYLFGPNIPGEILQQILALDRETLIADLEKVLKDAEDRYLFFRGPEGQDEEHDAPFHAIILLAELKAEKSLSRVLDFLENQEKVLDFYLGDHLTETMWMPIYILGQNNPEALKQFLLKPGLYTYSKAEVSVAIVQIALHQPHRRDEMESIYREVFRVFLEAGVEDNLIDSDFLAMAIGDAIDCGFSDLLPLIKKLYDKEYVSLDMNGDYEDVEKSFRNPANIPDKREVENIFELYDRVVTTWVSYTGSDGSFEDDFDYDDEFDFTEFQQPAVSNKIGRNDPCPCGSGKKYKKCCLDKE